MSRLPRLLVAVCVPSLLAAGWAGRTSIAQPPGDAPPPGAFSPDQLAGGLGQQLVAGLKATPGCLGADAAAFTSGRLVIFGWFRDKAAALAWHSSDVHKQVSRRFAGGRTMDRVPMEHIPDGTPLMVVASVTMGPPAGNGAPSMSFGIEVYQPMRGGFTFKGGAFSPPEFQALMESPRDGNGGSTAPGR